MTITVFLFPEGPVEVTASPALSVFLPRSVQLRGGRVAGRERVRGGLWEGDPGFRVQMALFLFSVFLRKLRNFLKKFGLPLV